MTDSIDERSSRAAVYGLLAELWAQELTASSVLLADTGVGQFWVSLGGHRPKVLTQNLDALAEDFCRLFIGPKDHFPPMESVWVTGELQSGVVSSLTEFASIAEYDSRWPGMLLDHIANELQLMGLILLKSGRESDPARVEAAVDLAKTFFAAHLQWTAPFLTQVSAADASGFYGSLADVTDSFLNQEHSEYYPTAHHQ